MKPSVRSLFVGVAVAFFFTLTLAALAQEKPAASVATPVPAAESQPVAAEAAVAPVPAAPSEALPLRRIDEIAVEKSTDTPPPTKGKKSRSPQSKERSDAVKQRALERAARAESRTGEAIVNVFSDSLLESGKKADAVVAIFGNATAEGDVVDAVVAVFGDNRVTGPVGSAVVSVFGNSYINGPVKESVVVVFGDLELGPDAQIGGEVVCIGGTIKRDAAAMIKGPVQNIISAKVAWLRAWLHECLLKARPLAFAPNLGWAWMLAFGCLAFYALAALIFRTGVEKCLTTLQTRPGFSVLAALLTTLISPLVVVLLAMTGVGLIAVPFIGVGLFCATLFGKVVVLAWLGRCITRVFGSGPLSHVAFAVIVGGLIVIGLYTIPVIGFMAFKLVGWIGLGAVVYTIVLGMKRDKPAAPSAPRPTPVPPMMNRAAMGAATANFATANTVDVTATPVAPTSEPNAASAPGSEPPPIPSNMSAGFGAASFTAPPLQSFSSPPVASAYSVATLPRAGFRIRLGALLIDAILFGVVTGMVTHSGSLMFPVLAAYAAAMWKFRGTTIGGIICGLKVVRLDDRPLDWPTVIVRALGCFLSLAPAGLGFLWVIFDNEKQSWHDKIAGTTVVRMPKGVSLL
jgi:uncharacterized RDD family membrane protein YckC